jgi:hypothetical protein
MAGNAPRMSAKTCNRGGHVERPGLERMLILTGIMKERGWGDVDSRDVGWGSVAGCREPSNEPASFF